MQKLRIGLIGTGSIAQTAHLPLLSSMQEFELIGVCEKEKGTLRSVAQKFDLEIMSTDYIDFLKRDDLEAVIVATPTDTQFAIAKEAMGRGIHVLVEIPLALNHKETAELTRLAKKCEVVCMVGMNHRFRQDITVLKTMIQHGELGKIFIVESGWMNYQSSTKNWIRKKDRAGGGVFLDLGIVMIDLILWLLDFPEVRTLSANMYHNTTKNVEDSASCFFRTTENTSVQLNVSWSAAIEKQLYHINLYGTEGSASINPLVIQKYIAGSPVNVTPVLPEPTSSIFKRSYEHELRHFLGTIRGIHAAISTAAEASHRMSLVDAAYKSSLKNREIVLVS